MCGMEGFKVELKDLLLGKKWKRVKGKVGKEGFSEVSD